MIINKATNTDWNEKIESSSGLKNPLGLWSHLDIQTKYVPGITSVSDRMRYYSLLAWYYENLFESKILDNKEFERLFILTCLAHHNGDSKHPSLSFVFNKERFREDWASTKTFKLNFQIQGNGTSYYIQQMNKLRCLWTDQLNQLHRSKINKELSQIFPKVDANFLKQKQFSKEEIRKHLSDFCICKRYEKEIEIMTKLLFGFISYNEGEWLIDEDSYNQFLKKKSINLSFKGYEIDTDNLILSNVPDYIEMNQRRRNTLFMFLKIIAETNPKSSELRQCIFDAIYFKQNRCTKEPINFGELKNVVKYWELLQLNIYYVYSIEMIFDVIQEIVYDETGILKEKILSSLDKSMIFSEISRICDTHINDKASLSKIIDLIWKISPADKGLKAKINESVLYDNIRNAEDLEVIIANAVLLVFLLKRRFESIDKRIKENMEIERIDILDKLRIDSLFSYIDQNKNKDLIIFCDYLIKSVIERHLYESSVRMSWGTKNWLFVEEDSRIFFSKRDMIDIHTRDNRWLTILHLMQDIEMIEVNNQVQLTDKGKKWLKLANLI